MSPSYRIHLVDLEPRLVALLRYVFFREGVGVSHGGGPKPDGQEHPDVVILAPTDSDANEGTVAIIRETIPGAAVLVLSSAKDGRFGVRSREVRARPQYVRDVVTLVRLLLYTTIEDGERVSGDIEDHFSMLGLVRSISSLNQSLVLSLGRGLRRGEIRFYRGEITSAQVGMLHGIAALHQLLLWSNGSFEVRVEEIVRRHQIPLARQELVRNMLHFIEGARDVASSLSPSRTYALRAGSAITDDSSVPEIVRDVIELFDGFRRLVDVVEDSPVGVIATLRVATQLHGEGVLEDCSTDKSDSDRFRLPFENWVAGDVTPGAAGDGESPGWDGLPTADSSWLEDYSPVVPATSTTGEIVATAAPTPSQEIADTDVAPMGNAVEPAVDELSTRLTTPLHRERALPSIVIDGIEVLSDDAREAASLAAVVANIPDGAGDEFEEVTIPGKRIPGHYGMPAEEAEPVPVASALALDTSKETERGDLAGSDLGSHAERIAKDASAVAEFVRFSDSEEAFFSEGARISREGQVDGVRIEKVSEDYVVPESFWRRFWSARDRGETDK